MFYFVSKLVCYCLFVSSKGVRPFVTCAKQWISTNCVAEDKPEVVVKFLTTMQDAYCDGAKAKPALLKSM